MPKLSCFIILALLSFNSPGQNTGVGTATPVEKLDVNGAIRIGNTTNSNQGSIRYNNGKFEGMNNLMNWGILGVPSNTLITVIDTTGILGQGYSIYGKQFINMQYKTGTAQGSWQDAVFTSASTVFVNVTGIWTGSEILVYYNNFIYRLNPITNVWTQSVVNPIAGFQPRIGYSAVWTGTELIIFGGFVDLNAFNDGVKYNPSTDTWTAIADAPVQRADHSAIFTNNEMIVFGGDSVRNTPCLAGRFSSNEIWKYNYITDEWTGPLVVSGPVPTARRNHVSVWTGTEMLVFGGSQADEGSCNGYEIVLNDTYSFNPATNKWSQKASGTPYKDLIGIWDGSKLRIWGSNMFDGFPSVFGESYDPFTNTWSNFPNENAHQIPANAFAIWNGTGMYVVDHTRYQVFDPVTGTNDVFSVPMRQQLYILLKN